VNFGPINSPGHLLKQLKPVCEGFSCTGDAVLTTDTSNQVTELNPVAETLTGWTSEEAIGRKLGDVFQIIDGTTPEALSKLTPM
jgi:PAS domain-containing protein